MANFTDLERSGDAPSLIDEDLAQAIVQTAEALVQHIKIECLAADTPKHILLLDSLAGFFQAYLQQMDDEALVRFRQRSVQMLQTNPVLFRLLLLGPLSSESSGNGFAFPPSCLRTIQIALAKAASPSPMQNIAPGHASSTLSLSLMESWDITISTPQDVEQIHLVGIGIDPAGRCVEPTNGQIDPVFSPTVTILSSRPSFVIAFDLGQQIDCVKPYVVITAQFTAAAKSFAILLQRLLVYIHEQVITALMVAIPGALTNEGPLVVGEITGLIVVKIFRMLLQWLSALFDQVDKLIGCQSRIYRLMSDTLL